MNLRPIFVLLLITLCYNDPVFSQDCLVARYPLNGNVNDTSGNMHNGTITSATYGADRNFMDFKALMLDGLSEFVDIPYHSDFNMGGPITIMAWINTTGSPDSVQGIFSFGTALGTTAGYYLRLNEGKASFGISRPYTECIGNMDIVANQWYHIAATYNDTTMKVFVNGELDNSKAIMNGLDVRPGTAAIQIGHEGAGEFYFKGKLDEVTVFSCSKSDQEIKQIYNDQLTAVDKGKYHQFLNYNLYPNPGTGVLTVSGSVSIDYIEVYNMVGQKVEGYTLNGATEGKINIDILPKGTYSLRVVTTSGEADQLLFSKI